jgi:hypothetical protein
VKSSKLFLVILAAVVLLHAAAARAAGVDMNDPRRALGREDDVRIDAQLLRDSVSIGSPIGVTYQIHNLTAGPIAIADRITDISYDAESLTITLSVGSEVPPDGVMPKMTVIMPGEKKTFSGGGMLHVRTPARAPSTAAPRYVQIKVNIQRNPAPFVAVASGSRMSDPLFSQWLESNDAIFLNSLPVRYNPRGTMPGIDASQRRAGSL